MPRDMLVEPPVGGTDVRGYTIRPALEERYTDKEKVATARSRQIGVKKSRKASARSSGSGVSYRQTSSRRGTSPCYHCKKRRIRCTGQPPACESCNKRGLDCSWSGRREMVSHTELHQVLLHQKTQLDDLNILVAGLRTDSEDGSTMILAKLRLGASVETLAKSIREGSVLDPSTFIFEAGERLT